MSDIVQETVLGIYDAAADNTLWPDILQRFADQIDARGCIIFEWRGLPDQRELVAPIASSYYDPDAIRTYVARCFEHEAMNQDVFEAHSLEQDRIDLIEDDVLAPSLQALKELPNVQVLRKLGILHRAAGLLNKDNTAISRFSIQLADTRGRLTDKERHHISQILPHIAKAMDLGRPAQQLATEHYGMMEAMDRLVIGVCVLDAKGRIVTENQEFKRQREIHQGFLKSYNGVLQMSQADDQKRFEALKAHALRHGRFGARPRKEAISTESEGFLCIEVVPLHRAEELSSKVFGGVIVYSTDTSLPIRCSTAPIQTSYGLTDSELALVELIADGLTNAQIAERRDRSVTTINTQVKSILAKTQCATRTQFVRLMMSFGASYLSEDHG